MEEFSNHNLLGKAPLLVREDGSYKSLKDALGVLEKERTEIVKRIKEQLESEETLADKIIKELFGLSTSIDSDKDDIFVRAQRRALCHTPPGKSENIGDRLAWESLLEALPEGSKLHLITDDGDYESDLTPGQPRPYLQFEWNQKKSGEVFMEANIPVYCCNFLRRSHDDRFRTKSSS
jgi:hypothetical protein